MINENLIRHWANLFESKEDFENDLDMTKPAKKEKCDEECDEEVCEAEWSLDDIISGNAKKAAAQDPGKSSENRKVVSKFELKDVFVNGERVDIKKLKTAFDEIPDNGDSDDGDDNNDDNPPEEYFDYTTGGAISIAPDDKVEVTGSVKYKDGTVDELEKVEVQGPETKGSVQKELGWLTNQKLAHKGVCEYYALMSLMLKNAVKDADDLESAQYIMFDKMNKDKDFPDMNPSDKDADVDDQSDSSDTRRGGSFQDTGGEFRFGDVEAAYDDDYQDKDVRAEFDVDQEIANESVGQNFVKWALMG